METMIIAYIKENHREWDEKIPEFTFCINTASQETLQLSPAILNFGRQPMAVNSLRRQVEIEMDKKTEPNAIAAWLECMKKLPELHQVAVSNDERAQVRQATYFNKHRQDVQYQKGDKVWQNVRTICAGGKPATPRTTEGFPE